MEDSTTTGAEGTGGTTTTQEPAGPSSEDRVPAAARPAAPAPVGVETLWRLVLVTLLIGFGVTAALTLLSHSVYEHEQQRLLRLRVRDAEAVVTAALPSLQTPLASAAELADATSGDAAKFRRFIEPYVGATAGQPFISASLWKLSDPRRGPVAVVGQPPRLTTAGVDVPGFFARAARSDVLVVIGLLSSPQPRLGYAFTTPGRTKGYATYAEARLPANHRSPLAHSSSFAGLDYALFLGRTTQPRRLLLTNVARLPLTGQVSSETVPFGDSSITLVMATNHSLAGSLPEDLPWIIAGGGGLLSLIAASVAFGLGRRRRRAERLSIELEQIAAENRRLYGEQRTIARTLQHALLPEDLPQRPDLETCGRYLAGEQSIEIGGDWYDVIERSGRSVLLVVGDVSGRGLRAATTMAALRFAIHAYAAQGDPPEAILGKLTGMISVTREGQLATVLCADIDLDRHGATIASAGHLPPLLVADGQASYLRADTGLPIGIDHDATYTSRTVELPRHGTLLAFTDGLVERRGESLDRGLERARAAATGPDSDLPRLLGKLLSAGPSERGLDDIAIVGVRWTS